LSCGADQCDRARGEDQREALLVQAVAALQHERRTGDVGEQPRHRQRSHQHQDHEPQIGEQLHIGGRDRAHAQRAAVRRRQGLGQHQGTQRQQPAGQHDQHREHPVPARVQQHRRTQRGRDDRSHPED
jgi:hypothetical protein